MKSNFCVLDSGGKHSRFLRHAAKGRPLPVAIVVVTFFALLTGPPLTRSAAIINGNTPTTAPSWAVALVHIDNGNINGSHCSGVLIAPNLVLTAKHCEGLGDPPAAVIGRSEVYAASTGRIAWITTTYPYPAEEDIAVMQLDEPINLTPIQISPDDISAKSNQIPYTIYGYGIIVDLPVGEFDNLLHTAVGLMASCPDGVNPPVLCLRSVSIQAPCNGDSGGPIVNPQGQLSGILFYIFYTQDKTTCLGSLWGVVSMSKPVTAWLEQIINDHGQSPARQG